MQVRDSFRKLCLGMCHEFAGLGVSKTNAEQIAFAYYLIRKISLLMKFLLTYSLI